VRGKSPVRLIATEPVGPKGVDRDKDNGRGRLGIGERTCKECESEVTKTGQGIGKFITKGLHRTRKAAIGNPIIFHDLGYV